MGKGHEAGTKGAVFAVVFKAALVLGLDPEMAGYAALGVQLLGGYIGSTLRDGGFLETDSDQGGLKRFFLLLGRNCIG
jgi:hypothetical protein